jgi:hypothetical protein
MATLDRRENEDSRMEASMAYDEGLAGWIRSVLRGRDDVVEKKMFGGLTFMGGWRAASSTTT